jgi:hypothetical protein
MSVAREYGEVTVPGAELGCGEKRACAGGEGYRCREEIAGVGGANKGCGTPPSPELRRDARSRPLERKRRLSPPMQVTIPDAKEDCRRSDEAAGQALALSSIKRRLICQLI